MEWCWTSIGLPCEMAHVPCEMADGMVLDINRIAM